jgi:hypothetical protein
VLTMPRQGPPNGAENVAPSLGRLAVIQLQRRNVPRMKRTLCYCQANVTIAARLSRATETANRVAI